MSLTNSTSTQQFVTLPYWQPATALTWFMTWIQPWIALVGIVDRSRGADHWNGAGKAAHCGHAYLSNLLRGNLRR